MHELLMGIDYKLVNNTSMLIQIQLGPRIHHDLKEREKKKEAINCFLGKNLSILGSVLVHLFGCITLPIDFRNITKVYFTIF